MSKKIHELAPHGFESVKEMVALRKRVTSAIERYPVVRRQEIALPSCEKGARCNSGLCPVCVRRLRCKLLRFAHKHRLHERQVSFCTVRVSGWEIAPGDYSRFADRLGESNTRLADLRRVKAMQQRLRRCFDRIGKHSLFTGNRVYMVGALEVSNRSVGNERRPKDLHMHFLVWGLATEFVREELEKLFPYRKGDRVKVPVQVVPIEATWEDFARVTTYCVAQPLQRDSFKNEADKHGRSQKPKGRELAEIASNLGAHAAIDRLMLMGIRYERGKFRLL